MQHEVAEIFFGQVVKLAREQGWVSDEHFSVDGTLIESWASLKSFVPKDQPRNGSDDNDPGNADVNFGGKSAATPRMRAPLIRKPGCARRPLARKPN